MAKLLYQGHGSYRITTDAGTVVYVDPYVGEGYDVPADIVFVTHEHSDHNQVQLVTLKPSGRICRAANLLKSGTYKTVTIADVTAQAVPACNENHPVDECVGLVLSFDGLKVYASGDTSKTDYMQTNLAHENLDYAILPIDGIYNMGPAEASECATIIGAKHSIPVHMAPGKLFSAKQARKFSASGKLVLEPGDEIEL